MIFIGRNDDMGKTIAFINQKGGVGKTATTVSVGIGLARSGKKVLLVDADPQGNLTDSLGFKNPDELETTLCTLMQKYIDDTPPLPGEGIIHQSEGVDLIPGNIELSGLEVSLVNAMSRESVLRAALADEKKNYDYILIDCPPSLNMLTINAMTAADSLIIPCQADYLPAKGLALLLKSANRVKKQLNPGLQIDGILLTMVDKRTNFNREMSELLRNAYGEAIKVYNTEIPFSVKAKEASADGKSIYLYDKNGKVAVAYHSFICDMKCYM